MILKLHTHRSWCLTRPGIAILGASISLGDEPVKENIPRLLIFTSQNCQTKYSTLTSRENELYPLGLEELRNDTDFSFCYCSNKFDCLINEMLFLRKLQPSLRVRFFKKTPRLDSKIWKNPKIDLRFLTKQINPRSFGSWFVKETEESTSRLYSSVPLMHHDPKDLGLICLVKKRKIHFGFFQILESTLGFS